MTAATVIGTGIGWFIAVLILAIMIVGLLAVLVAGTKVLVYLVRGELGTRHRNARQAVKR
jgi:hypothetical protein